MVESHHEPVRECHEDELKRKLTDLTASDLNAISGMTDGAAKSKKIEELLGKIVQLFIADLGLHIANLQVNSTPPGGAPPIVNPHEVSPQQTPVPQNSARQDVPIATSKKKFIVQILNARDVEAVQESLKQMVHTNLYDDLKNAAPVSQVQLERLFGRWEGVLHRTDSSKVEKLSFSLERSSTPNIFKYYANRGYNDRSAGRGNLKDWGSLDGEVMIAAGDNYWALSYNSALDEWFGLFYQNISKGKYAVIGEINLKRVR